MSIPRLQIGAESIPRIEAAKSLGVHIDQTLSWLKHVERISKKISSSIGALKRIRAYVPMTSLLAMYNSLIQPKCDYCSIVWEVKLQKLHNWAARIITHSPFDACSGPLLESLG